MELIIFAQVFRLQVGLALLLFSLSCDGVNALTTTSQERATLLELLPKSGFICKGPEEVSSVCEACAALEGVDATTSITGELDGTWRLRFTSASPYGLLRSLPEDATTQAMQQVPESITKFLIDDSALLPSAFEQQIDRQNSRIVNRLDLVPWPTSSDTGSGGNPFGDALQQAISAVPGPLGQTLEALQEAKVVLELDHSFVSAEDEMINMSLEVVRRNLESAGSELPSFIPRESIYQIPEPFQPSGSFKTTFLDETLHVARGSGWLNDEVFIFERMSASDLAEGVPLPSPEAATDLPDECELSYSEEDGTPEILCDPDYLSDSGAPSD